MNKWHSLCVSRGKSDCLRTLHTLTRLSLTTVLWRQVNTGTHCPSTTDEETEAKEAPVICQDYLLVSTWDSIWNQFTHAFQAHAFTMTVNSRSTENCPNYYNRVSRHLHLKAEVEIKQPVNNYFPKTSEQRLVWTEWQRQTSYSWEGNLP